jgi:predicted GIY-YIG superfamily endonuclease
MEKYYVYTLLNSKSKVEYVGVTTNPKQRYYQHTKHKPAPSHTNGKFYYRSDITMRIEKEYDSKTEAYELEGKLKLKYGLDWTEKSRGVKGGTISGQIALETGRVYELSKMRSLKVDIFFNDTGEYCKTYPSLSEACRDLGIHLSNGSACLNGKLKQTGGYIIKLSGN